VRVVLDTNTLVSAAISSGGPPRQLLDAARAQAFELCSSTTLLAELLDVLSRQKFSARLTQAGLTPQTIVVELRRMAYMAAPQEVPRVIEHDGDKHLLHLGDQYQGIAIVTAAQAVQQISV